MVFVDFHILLLINPISRNLSTQMNKEFVGSSKIGQNNDHRFDQLNDFEENSRKILTFAKLLLFMLRAEIQQKMNCWEMQPANQSANP